MGELMGFGEEATLLFGCAAVAAVLLGSLRVLAVIAKRTKLLEQRLVGAERGTDRARELVATGNLSKGEGRSGTIEMVGRADQERV